MRDGVSDHSDSGDEMDLHVYIPTRGRIYQQKSVQFLRLRERSKITYVAFVVPRCEVVEFRRTCPWARTIAINDEWKIGTISQWILEHGKGRYKVLIDDDFQLLRRRNRNLPSQAGGKATDVDAAELFDRIGWWLSQGYVHGGISLRQTNHFCRDTWYKTDTRMSGFMFFDTDIVNAEGVRFDGVQERQDFHLVLSLLELGYHNVVDYEFAVGQYLTGTNAAGGCSRYRTPEFLLRQAKRLAELHPASVKIVYKKRVSGDACKMGSEDGIPDVRISWARSVGIRKHARKIRVLPPNIKRL